MAGAGGLVRRVAWRSLVLGSASCHEGRRHGATAKAAWRPSGRDGRHRAGRGRRLVARGAVSCGARPAAGVRRHAALCCAGQRGHAGRGRRLAGGWTRSCGPAWSKLRRKQKDQVERLVEKIFAAVQLLR